MSREYKLKGTLFVCRVALIVAFMAAGYCLSLAEGKWILAIPFLLVGGGIGDCMDNCIREFDKLENENDP